MRRITAAPWRGAFSREVAVVGDVVVEDRPLYLVPKHIHGEKGRSKSFQITGIIDNNPCATYTQRVTNGRHTSTGDRYRETWEIGRVNGGWVAST